MALTLGMAMATAKGVFDYNRESFKFDREQRIERQELRFEMQCKRFELFREDVRDLMALTVDRMDIYHLIGALFLEFCIVLFTEGRVQESAAAPPFLLSLFFLSNSCAFIYLLLAVWLSMHASIASHSFGVRLLTRFVRLPIPSLKQMDALKAQYADFEQQGAGNVLRLPFLGQQDWSQVKEGQPASGPESKRIVATSTSSNWSPQAEGLLADASSQASSPDLSPRKASKGSKASGAAATEEKAHEVKECHLPEEAEHPMGGDDLLSGSSGALPERHIQLFRELQSKWQCYDAYCRVCMSLGVNQILQGLSYYAVCHTLVENHTATAGYAMIAVFQCTTVALAVLDLAGMRRKEIVAIQVVGMLPCFLTAWGLAGARDEDGELKSDYSYPMAPFTFLFQAFWLEMWLQVSSPGGSASQLPRRFRQVLFLDVFGDATSSFAPSEEKDDLLAVFDEMGNTDKDAEELGAISAAADKASSHLLLVQNALRRWRAVPDWAMRPQQRQEVDQLMRRMRSSGREIKMEVDKLCTIQGEAQGLAIFEEQLSRWADLPGPLREADPFASTLLGPFRHDPDVYHYDLENQNCIFEDAGPDVRPDARVLTLPKVKDLVASLEAAERKLLEVRILRECRLAELRHPRQKPDLSSTVAQAARVKFPNLAQLWRQSFRSAQHPLNAPVERAGEAVLMPDGSIGEAGTATGSAEGVAGAAGQEAAEPAKQDPTLVAMAGSNAKHFVPERLPWEVLRWTTRSMQACLIFCCVFAALNALGWYKGDVQRPVEGSPEEERQLCANGKLTLERVEVSWPFGPMFNPKALICDSTAALPGSDVGVAVISPFARYHTRVQGLRAAELSETDRVAPSTPASAVICSEQEPQACILATPTETGLSFRAGTEEAEVRVVGTPWRLATGAVANCSAVASLAPFLPLRDMESRCLLLAGWDGDRSIAVAVLPVSSGASGLLPTHLTAVWPSSEVPVARGDAERGILAMDVSTHEGRLSILLEGGRLEAWDLLRSQSLGRWKLRWPEVRDFRPAAICSFGREGLLVAGRSGVSSRGRAGSRGSAGAPVLLRGELPPSLELETEEGL